MGFLAEILAVAVVWLSSFALCQLGVAIENHPCPHAKPPSAKTVLRSPRDMVAKPAPIAAAAPSRALRDA